MYMQQTMEQSMAVFFMCILLAVLMAVGFVVYFVWKKFCKQANRKCGVAPPLTETRQNSRSMSTTIDLPNSTEEYNDAEDSENDLDLDENGSPSPSATIYTFPNEGVRCFRQLKPISHRQGDLFAHPSSYRQNLSFVGRNLKTVEEVEEGMDSPPRYEELFPLTPKSSLPIQEEIVYNQRDRDSNT